jgi:hypothetical protein
MSLRQGCRRSHCHASANGSEEMSVVQCKPRSPEGILKVIKQTRLEAMHAANDPLAGGMAFVTSSRRAASTR